MVQALRCASCCETFGIYPWIRLGSADLCRGHRASGVPGAEAPQQLPGSLLRQLEQWHNSEQALKRQGPGKQTAAYVNIRKASSANVIRKFYRLHGRKRGGRSVSAVPLRLPTSLGIASTSPLASFSTTRTTMLDFRTPSTRARALQMGVLLQ